MNTVLLEAQCVYKASGILHVHIRYMYQSAANMHSHNPIPNAGVLAKCENDMTKHTDKTNSH